MAVFHERGWLCTKEWAPIGFYQNDGFSWESERVSHLLRAVVRNLASHIFVGTFF